MDTLEIKRLFYTTNPVHVLYTNGNKFVRRTGTFSFTCLACIIYNWEFNSRDDNKPFVMGKKTAVVVTSLLEKLFDPQLTFVQPVDLDFI
jgi:hypothetical protein